MQQQTATAQAQEAKYFSDTFEQFAEQMAAWAEEFGQRMEDWSEEFGPRMETWAEELAQKIDLAGERIRQWLEEQAASRAPPEASSLQEERLTILRMVAEGKISVTEAESLLCALGEKSNHLIIERYLDRRRPL